MREDKLICSRCTRPLIILSVFVLAPMSVTNISLNYVSSVLESQVGIWAILVSRLATGSSVKRSRCFGSLRQLLLGNFPRVPFLRLGRSCRRQLGAITTPSSGRLGRSGSPGAGIISCSSSCSRTGYKSGRRRAGPCAPCLPFGERTTT